jgi:xylitol oxidase
MGFTPSAGEEIQSEYLVPRARAREAVAALRERAAAIVPVLQVSELRTVAADDLWMSTAYGRDSFAIHFTWERDAAAVARALAHVEDALLPLEARPHWGKVSLAPAAGNYPRVADFTALTGRLDLRGAFRNAWFEQQVRPSA